MQRDSRFHMPAIRHIRRTLSGASLLLFALVVPGVLQSQGVGSTRDTIRLSLPELRLRALDANPDLLAAGLDTAVARGTLRQAGILRFNPSFEVASPGAGKGVAPAISQEIELFGQRGARLGAAGAGVERARAGVLNARRLTIGEVDRAFFRLVSSARRADLAREVLGLNQRLTDIASKQLQAGEISRLDYNLVLVEVGRARARALATDRERAQTNFELARLIGVPATTPIAPVLPASELEGSGAPASAVRADSLRLDVDSLTALALTRRPDLAALAAATREATGQARVARREALPNLVVRAVSEQEGDESRLIRPGLGISLPFFNRNQGEVEARRAVARQTELQRAALVAQVRADIAGNAAALQAADAEVRVLESTVLAPARQNRQLLEIAYREGKVGLPVLLLIRNQVIDAELEYWSAWLAAREASATLAEATGENGSLPVSGPRP